MGFREGLVESTKSDASAYMQYMSGRDREGFRTYAFVEDDEDMSFYQHVITEEDNICFLSCGGKENVLKVFRKLKSQNSDEGLLFFVDRDTEQEPFEANAEVCRTKYYSWENYTIQEGVVEKIIARRFRPTFTPNERKWAVAGWVKTIENFSEVLAWHVSLTRLAKEGNRSFGMRKMILSREAKCEEGALAPGGHLFEEISNKRKIALDEGIERDVIDAMWDVYGGSDLLNFCRGKNLFQIFRTYISFLEKEKGVKFFGDYSSPASIILYIPSRMDQFEHIREYTNRRLSTHIN